MNKINIEGVKTLYLKETMRFLKVYNQTLFAPVINALLFLAIFNLALGDRVKNIGTVPFAQFMTAGLIMMSLVQNAFANSSSSFIMGKVMGTIIDYLTPPISPTELTFAVIAAAMTRGIAVGILVAIAASFFVPLEIHNVYYVIFHLLAASMLLGLLGMLGGIFAQTFDQMAAVTSYVITPMAFLSGTFYSVKNLPEFWYNISLYNPFFYMIDGFRYGMTGYHDSNLQNGIIILIIANTVLAVTVQRMLTKGYRIKN